MSEQAPEERPVGRPDLRLPDDLRGPLKEHRDYLRQRYLDRGWGGPVGFGEQPALLVIDLALGWTTGTGPMASNLDPVVEATCRVLAAAREAGIPIFFTTAPGDPAHPSSPGGDKLPSEYTSDDPPNDLMQLDPRLEHRQGEKIIRKPYASTFKGTNFLEQLASLRVDTLIVTGCSTSHCVYATCRDAKDSFHVIVPEEAVGERCELMHEVFLLDIGIDLGDVLPVGDVVSWLEKWGRR